MVELDVTYPGTESFGDRSFYVEGSQHVHHPIEPCPRHGRAVLNVSPAAYYDTDVFLP